MLQGKLPKHWSTNVSKTKVRLVLCIAKQNQVGQVAAYATSILVLGGWTLRKAAVAGNVVHMISCCSCLGEVLIPLISGWSLVHMNVIWTVTLPADLSEVGHRQVPTKVENGHDKSLSVHNRIPYFLVCFRFLRDKRKRDRKRDGLKRERDRKR